ncbi:hypothetical protein L208DRAFT_1211032, partial [Tricholoma matsutake]
PTHEQVIETMQSKTFWYNYICKYFPCVAEHSHMVAWLEDNEDVPSDLEVWKVEKGQYGFVDLHEFLRRGVEGIKSDSEELDRKKKNKKGKEKEKG